MPMLAPLSSMLQSSVYVFEQQEQLYKLELGSFLETFCIDHPKDSFVLYTHE
jgi:hypothetical protein